MPRIKKTDVVVSETIKPTLEKSEGITIKRIHRRTPKKVETPKETVIPISSLLPVEEIKEIESVEDPEIEEVQKVDPVEVEISDEVAQEIKREFLEAPRSVEQAKNKIEKVEKEVKSVEQKKEEVEARNCHQDLIFTPFMMRFLNSIFFVFASSILIGLNILILTFFAYLMACMFH